MSSSSSVIQHISTCDYCHQRTSDEYLQIAPKGGVICDDCAEQLGAVHLAAASVPRGDND